jgi:hypothetical protein
MVQLLGSFTKLHPLDPCAFPQPQSCTCAHLSNPSNTQPLCLSDRYNRTFNTNTYPIHLSHSRYIQHVSRLFGGAIALEPLPS